MRSPLEIRDIDRKIWEQELESFVPEKLFDAHSHIYKWDFNLDPQKQTGAMSKLVLPHYAESSFARLDEADGMLMPGREVHRL